MSGNDNRVQRRTRTASEIKVYGRVGSTEGYEIRDFLTRTVVEFEWIDVSCEEDCHTLTGLSGFEDLRFPVVEMPDGERLFAPRLREIADRLGWVTTPRYREYDVSIYGAGPSGLSAAVYAASEGLRTVLIERHAVGGQAGTSSLIENYMGFPQGISGAALAEQARQQVVKFGAELIMMGEGVEATFDDNRIHVTMADGGRMVAKANICATGVEYRKLGVADEERFLGNGIFYGAGAAEAPYCREKEIFVVGGGNSAGQAVMHFADYARRVTMLVRGESLSDTLSDYLIARIYEKQN
ncbi:MAG: FAD-dependent oxidoreductase, partial [Pseudomonadota bacterium]